MPTAGARQDMLTGYEPPTEMIATGEIIGRKPHVQAVMAVEGDRAIAGHLHCAQVGT